MQRNFTARVVEGDCREVLAGEAADGMAADSFDACVCDPPYELGFMSKEWDQRGVAFDPATWAVVLRVLKPGAHIVAFGGTRTHHRLMCAIEDAGFEVRDALMWIYGQGFPKSRDVSKAIDKAKGVKRPVVGQKMGTTPSRSKGAAPFRDDSWMPDGKMISETAPATPAAAAWQGWGTALKPAWEPIILARKPLSKGSVAANVLRWGTGAINVGGCRIGTTQAERDWMEATARPNQETSGWGKMRAPAGFHADPAGRWPANLILAHDPRCVLVGTEAERGVQRAAGSPGFGAKRDDGYQDGEGRVYAEGGERDLWACVPSCPARMLDEQSGQMTPSFRKGNRASKKDGSVPFAPSREDGGVRCNGGHYDSGGASRFFYTAKSSSAERVLGCPPGFANKHPTVKPLALMRWLVRLVTPPGGVVLDPFAGSGSTLVAAMLEGHDSVGIDSDPESVACARGRIAAAEEWGASFTGLKKVRVKRRRFRRGK